MPTYSYDCLKCGSNFELFYYIRDYQEKPQCTHCGSSKTNRSYVLDVLTQSTSIKKTDSELKTIGDLAKRNADKLSEDEKIHLHQKHNSYKYESSTKELPNGMSRIKKPKKPKWPGSQTKNKRKPKT
jgi:putative FmdB family regulatory protein